MITPLLIFKRRGAPSVLAASKKSNICAWMAFMCAHNAIIPGSGGGTSISACDWVKKNCK